jgi:hypothetical protein
MRRVVDLFLVLGLVLAVVYLFQVQGAALGGVWFGSATPTEFRLPTRVVTFAATPTRLVIGTPSPTSTPRTTPTRTPTPPPSPTLTLTGTATEQAAAAATPTLLASTLDEIDSTIQLGEQIVQAIEAYLQAEGGYPPALEALAPAFLPDVPSTATGQQFFYRVFDDSSPLAAEAYWVAFRVDGAEHVTCTYLRRLDYWDCNFASP